MRQSGFCIRHHTIRMTLLVVFLNHAVFQSTAHAQDDVLAAIEERISTIVDDAEPSVVSLARVPRPALAGNLQPIGERADPDDPSNPEFIPYDFGSGVLVQTGHSAHPLVILTNYHVIKGGPVYGKETEKYDVNIYAWLNDRTKFLASILAADPHSDLAVLSVDRRLDPKKHPGLKVEPVTNLRKGMFVFAFGNPYAQARDGSASVSWGNISNIARKPVPIPDSNSDTNPRLRLHDFGTLIQMSSRLPLGTSGGAVLDRRGRFIGLSTSRAALLGYEQSAGYAIPFGPGIARVIDELSQGLEAEYGFLGVSTRNATRSDMSGTPFAESHPSAAIVNHVFPNSPADVGGLLARDYVVGINNTPIFSQYDLMREVALLGPWNPARKNLCRMKIWRPAARKVLNREIQPGKWPVQDDAGIITTVERYQWRGIVVDHNTGRQRYMDLLPNSRVEPSVLVLHVSEIHGEKLQRGDFISHVNSQAVTTPFEFLAAVRSISRDTSVTLQLTDGRRVTIDQAKR